MKGINKWKKKVYGHVSEDNPVRMTILPKLIYGFNNNPCQNPRGIL